MLLYIPKLPRPYFLCDRQVLPYIYKAEHSCSQSLTPASVSGFLSPLSSSSSSSSSSSLGFRVLHRETMAAGFSRALLRALAFVAIAFAIASPALVHAGSPAPAPAPTSDGTSIDQGIAYVLMLVALVLTYLIHPLDASSYNFF